MKMPAERFKLLLAKPIAIACRRRRVVRRSVAFDCQQYRP